MTLYLIHIILYTRIYLFKFWKITHRLPAKVGVQAWPICVTRRICFSEILRHVSTALSFSPTQAEAQKECPPTRLSCVYMRDRCASMLVNVGAPLYIWITYSPFTSDWNAIHGMSTGRRIADDANAINDQLTIEVWFKICSCTCS